VEKEQRINLSFFLLKEEQWERELNG